MLNSYDKVVVDYIHKTLEMADKFNGEHKETSVNEDDVTRIEVFTLLYDTSGFAVCRKEDIGHKTAIKITTLYPHAYQSDKIVIITYPHRMLQRVEKFADTYKQKVKVSIDHQNSNEKEQFTLQMQNRGLPDNTVLSEILYRFLTEAFGMKDIRTEHFCRQFLVKNVENIKQYKQFGSKVVNMMNKLNKQGIVTKPDYGDCVDCGHSKLEKKRMTGGYYFYTHANLNKLMSQIIQGRERLTLTGGWGASDGADSNKIQRTLMRAGKKCGLKVQINGDTIKLG